MGNILAKWIKKDKEMDGAFGVTKMDKNIKVNGKMDKYMGEVEN